MSDNLPEWYPLANATDEEIDSWLTANGPPYDEMRAALPWLDKEYQFDAWIDGVREARSHAMNPMLLRTIFPGMAVVPFPPRRLAGRAAQ